MALHPNHLAQGSVKTNLSRICAMSRNNAISMSAMLLSAVLLPLSRTIHINERTKHPYRNACTLSQRAASLRMSFMYIPVLKLLSGYSSDLNEEKEEQARLT